MEEELGKKTYLEYLGATSFSLSTYWVSRFPTSGHQALGVFDSFQEAGLIIEPV